jgi:NAD(P)-dependent dehydrogenase (short-subunit alcohol dehydrogenase family)
MRFHDRVALITGGTKGIGEGCVDVFVEAGGQVVFCGLEPELGAAVADRVSATGPGTATFVPCDVTRHEDLDRLVAHTVGRYGRLDCLINNAGWHPPHRPIDEFTADDFRAILELNVISPFALCKAALPHLRESRGSIVNIASLVATIGQLHATTYVATKGAMVAFTKALAFDEAPRVRVNSVSPGNVFTPLWQEAIDASPDPAATRSAGEHAQPFGRMGTPREVGLLCLYLATDATFTTGVDHIVSGGAELGYARKTR